MGHARQPHRWRVVASRYPVLCDEGDELALLTHVGRPHDKDPLTRRQVLAALQRPGHYSNPELAAQMQQALEARA